VVEAALGTSSGLSMADMVALARSQLIRTESIGKSLLYQSVKSRIYDSKSDYSPTKRTPLCRHVSNGNTLIDRNTAHGLFGTVKLNAMVEHIVLVEEAA
jgi:hypothetical protein